LFSPLVCTSSNLYYESKSGNVKIYKEDCLKFLKCLEKESIDIIITDPAYSGMNQKMKFGNGRIVGQYEKEGNDKWFEEFHDTEENYRSFLGECKRVLKPNAHIYIMFDSFSLLSLGHLVREYFEVKNIIVWDKIAMGMGHNFRRRHEFIIFSTKGKKKLNKKSIPDVWRFKRIHDKNYPTQKPVELFQSMLIGSISNDGDNVVCDPFLGSGSSAIAALKNYCKFIGCDSDEKACKLSKKRIENYLDTGKDIYQKKKSYLDDELVFWESNTIKVRRDSNLTDYINIVF